MKNSWAKQTLGQTDEWTKKTRKKSNVRMFEMKKKIRKIRKKRWSNITELRACESATNAEMKQPCLSSVVHVRSTKKKAPHHTIHADRHTPYRYNLLREIECWIATTKIYKYLLKCKIRLAHARVLIKTKSKQCSHHFAHSTPPSRYWWITFNIYCTWYVHRPTIQICFVRFTHSHTHTRIPNFNKIQSKSINRHPYLSLSLARSLTRLLSPKMQTNIKSIIFPRVGITT